MRDLGYKNKEDAVKKLAIEAKDYIVIPISNDIKNISDLFMQEKQVKVEIDGKTFFTTYSIDVATGKINSNF